MLQGWALLALVAVSAQGVAADSLSVSLQISALVPKFQNMTVGQVIYPTDIGTAQVTIQLYKPTALSLRVIVFSGPVVVPLPRIIYTANYKWVAMASTLVAKECPPPKPTIPSPPTITVSCKDAISIATQLIETIIAAAVEDISTSGYIDLVNCLKQKLSAVNIAATTSVCLFQVLDDTDIATSMLKQKKDQLAKQGYLCGKDGSCSKVKFTTTTTTHVGLARASKSLSNAYLEDLGSL